MRAVEAEIIINIAVPVSLYMAIVYARIWV